MIGAMVVIVALVVGVVGFRSLFRVDADQGPPQGIEYLDTVQGLQANDFELVYPATLPEGWIVTEIRPSLGDRPSLAINLYTDEDAFVGIRQEDASVRDLLETFVDEDPVSEDPLTGVGGVAATWEGWSDSGGDRAFSADVGGDTVLVYGDVSVDELTSLIALLTTEPVPTRTS